MAGLVDQVERGTECARFLIPSGLPGQVDLHRDESIAQLAAQGLEAFRRNRRVGGEQETEYARARGALLHLVEVGIADADGQLALAEETAATAG